MKNLLQLFLFALCSVTATAQCVETSAVHSFTYDGKTYEIIKDNKNWVDAAACAVERGGYLAEVNSSEEQEAIFEQILALQIDPEDTKAPDGYSSYVWLGGNDIVEEGKWIWNGNNDATSVQFWQGTVTGSVVGGLYNNWGNEPDNSASGTGQDALGLAIIDWPLGDAGQWNDVKHTNELYFVVEYNTLVLGADTVERSLTTVYPNPASDLIFINSDKEIAGIVISNSVGQQVQTFNSPDNGALNLEQFERGIYFLNLQFSDGTAVMKKIIKE
jgi:hypothetical protein